MKPQYDETLSNFAFKFNLRLYNKDSATLLVTDAVVYVSENIPDVISDADLAGSGDDGNFTISALKAINLFDIATKAKERTRGSADMSAAEAGAYTRPLLSST